MKLYYSPGACLFATYIAMKEIGLKFETEAVDLKTHKYRGGDYYPEVLCPK